MSKQGCRKTGEMTLPNVPLRAGVRDMIRLSDDRLSDAPVFGTSHGTESPRVAGARARGPLGLVRTGDLITLGAPAGALHPQEEPAVPEARRAAAPPLAPQAHRGSRRRYGENGMQEKHGAQFDILTGRSGSPVGRATQ